MFCQIFALSASMCILRDLLFSVVIHRLVLYILETVPRQKCCCGSRFIIIGVNVICIYFYIHVCK